MSSSPTGNEPSKKVGQFHSWKGSIIEKIGRVVGSQSWMEEGKREREAGETEYEAGRAKGYAEGIANQVAGKVGSVAGTITGDLERRESGRSQQSIGKELEEQNKPPTVDASNFHQYSH
ncbi:hypothetical protein Clacol_009632 [Clathrus columnatus]|uniref:CsbD-like domain-containing protein n=1 Tax=Clathrus columnatus TaxID=1419009 RepID=A0AAV5AR50_9AGAM|nr:hypothetical protein Clacol_009632 [Clathrus columnatus]